MTPTFFPFILTDDQGTRTYGACLTIYEPISTTFESKLKKLYYIEKLKIYSPKALCIISSYSFIDGYKEILKQLYRLHLSKNPIPIERYICNFTDEIPIPIKGNNFVQYEIGTTVVNLYRPIDQIPPYASVLYFIFYSERIMSIYLDH